MAKVVGAIFLHPNSLTLLSNPITDAFQTGAVGHMNFNVSPCATIPSYILWTKLSNHKCF